MAPKRAAKRKRKPAGPPSPRVLPAKLPACRPSRAKADPPPATDADLARLAAADTPEAEAERVNDVAIRRRVAFALDELDEGTTYAKIVGLIMGEFGVTERTAERDMTRAYIVMGQAAGPDLEQRAARAERSLWRVAAKAEKDGDWKAAIGGFGRIASIYGMDAPKKVQVSGGMTVEQSALLGALQLTPTERQARIAELEAKATGAPPPASASDGDASDPDVDSDAGDDQR